MILEKIFFEELPQNQIGNDSATKFSENENYEIVLGHMSEGNLGDYLQKLRYFDI